MSFTGRDEDITDDDRHARRYTLSHLAEDVKRQTGVTEPLRDWFPLSASSALSDVTDLLKGPGADWGTLKCGCHPDCGIGTAFMVSKKTREWAPLGVVHQRRALPRRTRASIADSARGPLLTKLQTALSLLRNYSPGSAPRGFRLVDLLQKYDKQSGGQLGGKLGARDNGDRKQDEWLLMFVAGMWFQDLWTYDFRRTEMCIIPVRDADGRDLVLRLQHRRRLAADRREHVPERDRGGMVQGARQASGLREPAQAGAAAAGAQPVSLRIPRDGRLVEWQPEARSAVTGAATRTRQAR